MSSSPPACPLCGGHAHDAFHEDRFRSYLRCHRCALVFVPPEYYLTEQQEKAEYDLHDNQVHDLGYRKFLNRLWAPLSKHLAAGSTVLDFGCGPGPALADMMKASEMDVRLYDHFYYPDTQVLQDEAYHAITSTEVIEHLHTPQAVFAQWVAMLKSKGWLGVMTKLVKDQRAFAQWHYKNDRTHVCFFSRETFEWLAGQYGLSLQFHGNDVMLMQKP